MAAILAQPMLRTHAVDHYDSLVSDSLLSDSPVFWPDLCRARSPISAMIRDIKLARSVSLSCVPAARATAAKQATITEAAARSTSDDLSSQIP